jgi:hypothetical protein
MYVMRMREYKPGYPDNPNCPEHKIEVTTEHRAANFAHLNHEGWIYFFVDLTSPKDL